MQKGLLLLLIGSTLAGTTMVQADTSVVEVATASQRHIHSTTATVLPTSNKVGSHEMTRHDTTRHDTTRHATPRHATPRQLVRRAHRDVPLHHCGAILALGGLGGIEETGKDRGTDGGVCPKTAGEGQPAGHAVVSENVAMDRVVSDNRAVSQCVA